MFLTKIIWRLLPLWREKPRCWRLYCDLFLWLLHFLSLLLWNHRASISLEHIDKQNKVGMESNVNPCVSFRPSLCRRAHHYFFSFNCTKSKSVFYVFAFKFQSLGLPSPPTHVVDSIATVMNSVHFFFVNHDHHNISGIVLSSSSPPSSLLNTEPSAFEGCSCSFWEMARAQCVCECWHYGGV